jgi:hypothetical protein
MVVAGKNPNLVPAAPAMILVILGKKATPEETGRKVKVKVRKRRRNRIPQLKLQTMERLKRAWQPKANVATRASLMKSSRQQSRQHTMQHRSKRLHTRRRPGYDASRQTSRHRKSENLRQPLKGNKTKMKQTSEH